MNHPFPLNEKETALLHREEERLGITLAEWPRNPTYNMCFACGTENPIGLHLHFSRCRRDASPSSRPLASIRATMTACMAASS